MSSTTYIAVAAVAAAGYFKASSDLKKYSVEAGPMDVVNYWIAAATALSEGDGAAWEDTFEFPASSSAPIATVTTAAPAASSSSAAAGNGASVGSFSITAASATSTSWPGPSVAFTGLTPAQNPPVPKAVAPAHPVYSQELFFDGDGSMVSNGPVSISGGAVRRMTAVVRLPEAGSVVWLGFGGDAVDNLPGSRFVIKAGRESAMLDLGGGVTVVASAAQLRSAINSSNVAVFSAFVDSSGSGGFSVGPLLVGSVPAGTTAVLKTTAGSRFFVGADGRDAARRSFRAGVLEVALSTDASTASDFAYWFRRVLPRPVMLFTPEGVVSDTTATPATHTWGAGGLNRGKLAYPTAGFAGYTTPTAPVKGMSTGDDAVPYLYGLKDVYAITDLSVNLTGPRSLFLVADRPPCSAADAGSESSRVVFAGIGPTNSTVSSKGVSSQMWLETGNGSTLATTYGISMDTGPDANGTSGLSHPSFNGRVPSLPETVLPTAASADGILGGGARISAQGVPTGTHVYHSHVNSYGELRSFIDARPHASADIPALTANLNSVGRGIIHGTSNTSVCGFAMFDVCFSAAEIAWFNARLLATVPISRVAPTAPRAYTISSMFEAFFAKDPSASTLSVAAEVKRAAAAAAPARATQPRPTDARVRRGGAGAPEPVARPEPRGGDSDSARMAGDKAAEASAVERGVKRRLPPAPRRRGPRGT